MLPTETIHTTDVRDVLRQLSFDSTPSQTPLSDLSVVRRTLARNGFRPSREARQIEISRILLDVTESQLHRLRASHDAIGESLHDQIRGDFGAGHRDLEAWSAIYHLYLRTDMNLYLKDFEHILGDRHRRTIQRRLQRGVSLLTSQLQKMEHRSMEDERRERRESALPPAPDRALVGVDEPVELVGHALGAQRAAATALVGPSGIGKTAVARAAAWQHATAAQTEEIVWVNASPFLALRKQDSSAAIEMLIEASGLPIAAGAMADCLAHRRCLVVIDGINSLSEADACLSAVASLPERAVVLLTGRVRFARQRRVHTIGLGPLRPHAALELLKQEIRALGILDASVQRKATLLPIVTATAGHPEALRLAARQLAALEVRQVADDFIHGHGEAAALYENLWRSTFASASPSARDVVRAVVGIRRSGGHADPKAIVERTGYAGASLCEALCHATDLGLLEPLGSVQHRHYVAALFLDRFLGSVPEPTCASVDPAHDDTVSGDELAWSGQELRAV